MKKAIDLNVKRRTFVGGAVKGIDSEKRRIRAYASTTAWDRYGERFEARAFEDGLENYIKNPVILFAHDYTQEPIGKAIDWEFDAKGLILTMEFADTEKARQVFKLYEGGFMSAFSVGFRPKEVRWEERAPGVEGLVFVKAELLENSAVPVPANPEAVVIKGFGGKEEKLDGAFLRELMTIAYRGEDQEQVPAEPENPAAPEAPAAPAAEPSPAPAPAPEPAAAAPAAPAAAPAEAPKSLKDAVGYLLTLGKAAREKGKVEDEAVRSLLVQAVNLCRELVLGVGAQSLDGVDPARSGDDLGAEDSALLKELELLTDKLVASGKATPKDYQELASLASFIEEKVLGKKDTI